MGAYVWGAGYSRATVQLAATKRWTSCPFLPSLSMTYSTETIVHTQKNPTNFSTWGAKHRYNMLNKIHWATGLPIFSFKLQICISPPEWRKEKQRYGKKVQVRGSSITKSPWQGSFMTMWRISLQKGFCQWVMTSGINNGDCWCFDLSLMSLCV